MTVALPTSFSRFNYYNGSATKLGGHPLGYKKSHHGEKHHCLKKRTLRSKQV